MNLTSLLFEQNYKAIPLRATAFGHLEIAATINGIDVLFLLDTGAASTVIDTGFAAEHGLQVEETSITGGGVGTSELIIYQLATTRLVLAGFHVDELPVFAADLQHVKQSLIDKGETQIPCGVLGADLLFHHKAVIDYPSLQLFLQ